jgi:hypothetical protein
MKTKSKRIFYPHPIVRMVLRSMVHEWWKPRWLIGHHFKHTWSALVISSWVLLVKGMEDFRGVDDFVE